MTYYLTHPKGRHGCYGQINTPVTVVNTDHGNVWIVENDDGVRFSCRVDDLSEVEVIIEVYEEPKEIKQQLALF